MRHALIFAFATLAGAGGPAFAHTIFPGDQTVQTLGERALVRFRAANSRRDVAAFTVEVFEQDWRPYRLAVASPSRLTVRAQTPGDADEASQQPFSVLVDLDGRAERRLRVCTRSVAATTPFQQPRTLLNTRVCANVTVRRLAP